MSFSILLNRRQCLHLSSFYLPIVVVPCQLKQLILITTFWFFQIILFSDFFFSFDIFLGKNEQNVEKNFPLQPCLMLLLFHQIANYYQSNFQIDSRVCVCVCVCVCARAPTHTQPHPSLCGRMDCSPPGSFVHPRQEYCSGLPLSTPEDLPDLGILHW